MTDEAGSDLADSLRSLLDKPSKEASTLEKEVESAAAAMDVVRLREIYFVSTVGRNEEMIRAYIRNQEMADKQ
jgi:REP element-mobilizing transposase RayT